jgi:uncharacterized protein YdeI (YjbR/CyaY-like superfamily)
MTAGEPMTPVFFETPADLRRWFEANHATCPELWIGFYKKGSGGVAVTYEQALDESLCFGWIDGIVRSVNEVSYTNRFTPRKLRSTWSAINIARAQELMAAKRMQPPGLAAFERRTEERSRSYSYEQRRAAELSPRERREFEAVAAAWRFFSSQPPAYRRTAAWWVQTARKEETRKRRLAVLIDASARGQLAPPFIRRPRK